MRNRYFCIVVVVAAIVLAGASGFFLARCVQRGPASVSGSPPKQAGYSLGLSLEVADITPVSMADGTQFVQLTVRPWYGKIGQDSYNFHRKYETQEYTILLRAASGADSAAALARVGDILSVKVTKSDINVRGN